MAALSSHATRWIVAAILVPLVLAVLFLGPPILFNLIIIAVGILALREYYLMVYGPGKKGLMSIGFIGLVLIMLGAGFGDSNLLEATLIAALALGFIFFLLNCRDDMSAIINSLSRFALGHAYVSLFLSFALRIWDLPDGRKWIFLTLAVTFLSDTAAFYMGRTIGSKKLYPAVSPNKTVEGLLGGLAGGAITAGLIALFLLTRFHFAEAALLGAAMALWGAAGDLFESMIKRSAGAKDSGAILMGHGGMLDRIDALLFNFPLVYFFILVRFKGWF